ncbi:MAG: (2Fe-2S)-binding protein [Acidobacteria bacterium]|nr:MAG: (2Fe-2S)-binding protein [Acidobacteriota bacterium]
MADPLITVDLILNDVQRTFRVPPGRRLLDLIRDDAGLTGTKEGCGAGECGACTILLDGRPVPSCLVLAASCENRTVTTVEGLVHDGKPHPIQEAMVETGGVQCGFCTPGVIMTSAALLENSISDREDQGRRLAGNLCRCTGYEKIFKALEVAGDIDD